MRLSENANILQQVFTLFSCELKSGRRIIPAAEWLLDNYYLIEEQIRTAQRHLPLQYSRELPRLGAGICEGWPRVYELALEIVSHGDGRIDIEKLTAFISSYQSLAPLTTGELWAIPVMLRLALIENLRRVAVRLAISRQHHELAEQWVKRFLDTAENDPAGLILQVADLARSHPPMDSAFIAEMTRRLQSQKSTLTLPLNWVANRLAETGVTIEQLVMQETQRQASDQVSISNSITSIRLLGNIDWHLFFESVSQVEHRLKTDPAGVYSAMDFASRDHYRRVIENMAKYSHLTEEAIASKAINMAKKHALQEGVDNRAAHVGYYLIAEGRSLLEKAADIKQPLRQRVPAWIRHFPAIPYLGSILVLSSLFTAVMLRITETGDFPVWFLLLLGTTTLIASSHLAVSLVNWLSMLAISPSRLPRMDFSGGIPEGCDTVIAIPCMLISPENIDQLCETLEIHYLGNQDKRLRFCLLSDFTDAATEETEQDAKLLEYAAEKIKKLNRQYQNRDNLSPFWLLHRPRHFNTSEQIWMGQERKRGKLEELNAFLRNRPANFSIKIGDFSQTSRFRFVITLDSDTRLFRDTARQFIATLAHPLNKAVYDEKKRIVAKGYGILQPRVASLLPGSHASIYERLNSGDAGIDPYTRTVSDVYQDLFGEGSFIGKGIYDIDAVNFALGNRLPSNHILSHDLLEGCYARSGLVSDVSLYEKYPADYLSDVKRRHRWIRGDWQLVKWLFPCVPDTSAQNKEKRQPNPLSRLSRWKLFDNLRRSMVAPAVTFLFAAAWIALKPAWIWTLALLSAFFLPAFLAFLTSLIAKHRHTDIRQHLSVCMGTTNRQCSNIFLNFMVLPHEAGYHLDAIVRTLFRLLLSHRHLLEWIPSGLIRDNSENLPAYIRTMWCAPAFSLSVFAAVFLTRPPVLIVASPFLLLWLFSPLIAWFASQPVQHKEKPLSPGHLLYLRKLARKIWAFFDTHVTTENNWLPPDNIQEALSAAFLDKPLPPGYRKDNLGRIIACRTSPTNIGLALLAYLAAADFAYIPVGQAISRTSLTFSSLSRMDRYRGHFYNWYDTTTLKTIQTPLYLSTVDSGNLAGHLLTLKSGLQELICRPAISPRLSNGLYDTFSILAEYLPEKNELTQEITSQWLSRDEKTAFSLHDIFCWVERLANHAGRLVNTQANQKKTFGLFWAKTFHKQCCQMLEEISLLMPWVTLTEWRHQPDRFDSLNRLPTLDELAQYDRTVLPAIRQALNQAKPDEKTKLKALAILVEQAVSAASGRICQLQAIARHADEFARMDFRFLMNPSTRLLSIGFNVTEKKRDNSYYDLLASEARLTSFVAISQGQIPQENWFALGRKMVAVGKNAALLSWSGSMFEYLMPQLVMPVYEDTLLEQTNRTVVKKQMEYGIKHRLPWGISESGYFAFDANLHYQYRAFGVPGLGLKRGLGEDLVIAPYASMLALMIDPESACKNLIRLDKEGFKGQFGLFEAIDFTPARLGPGKNHAVIRSFMAHHQGMGLLALLSLLMNRPMQKRFEAEPVFKATLPLLQERVPRQIPHFEAAPSHIMSRQASLQPVAPNRIYRTANTPKPEIQLLSNGNYHVMLTNAGAGYSRWKDLAISRWQEDSVQDNRGTWFYVRDRETGKFWSTTYQPVCRRHTFYEVIFSEGKAEFRSCEDDIEIHSEIGVCPEENMEIRHHTLTSHALQDRKIEFTACSEIVIAPSKADRSHPAFSKLFIQTEIIPEHHAVISTRRPRHAEEKPPYVFHMMIVHGADHTDASYETDRMRFIGRGHTAANPIALLSGKTLSGSEGSVLDPVAAIRHNLILQPGKPVVIDYLCGIAENRETCLKMIEKYDDMNLSERVLELALNHGQALLRQLNAEESDAQLYAKLASGILYANRNFRAKSHILANNSRGQQGLWSYAISGDLPIVLLQISGRENLDMVRQIVQAHAYWHMKGLPVDLVIWNEDNAGYRQTLQEQITNIITAVHPAQTMNRQGGIFLRQTEQIAMEDRILISSAARIILSDTDGPLVTQLHNAERAERRKPALLPPGKKHLPQNAPDISRDDLLIFNGTGGFSPDGKEYVMLLSKEKTTPAPWVNILANPHFGCIISESGQSYTWQGNAHELRLTPWNNDPVSDTGGETFYLRDEESGHYWSPVPAPCPGKGKYQCRHGFGYSAFEHTEDGIRSELWVYVALKANIKYFTFKVRNESARTRQLSAAGYVEWVLGSLREDNHMYIITEREPQTGAILARNTYNTEFADHLAFFATTGTDRTITGNRAEFIGRNRTLANPAAMSYACLSNQVGAGYDPCGAIHVPFILEKGEERRISFLLGTADRRTPDISRLIRRFTSPFAPDAILEEIHQYWKQILGTVRLETPDLSLNILANGWLMYQTIACRLWARSGFYQSGGAFGFRDQLQDAMAVTHTAPDLLRNQILLHASRQFIEGDVQHWWHPPSGRGVRTRCSDDYLWLPLAVCRYIRSTGDTGILDESAFFLESPPVPDGQDTRYDMPAQSSQSGTIYRHCTLAIRHGLRFGSHGLPLIGTGDWNDGMDRVGKAGKGESIWLGFFLYHILLEFGKIARQYGDKPFAETCEKAARSLKQQLHDHAWDGAWYRRAYFDNGMPLGSFVNPECRIDSISQSWSVLSDAGEKKRAIQAMDSLNARLIRRKEKLIRLLTPPFDQSELDPGYIKGYVPGVRENGGQYTHAAIWAAMAFAKLKNNRLAWELFNLINPVNHSLDPESVRQYKVEPYVIAADIYALSPHEGRGGWTWYTGSAGWMYRLILESLIGISLEYGKLHFAPCLPSEWEKIRITYRHGQSTYHITMEQSDTVSGMEIILNGIKQENTFIRLDNDHQTHQVLIRVKRIPAENNIV
ncbi:MAG: cyclic beta 1-2 glucan synthetase [Oxalobacter formigenes]|nr:cyclic beta 1-2 glucan synthetase [Oxalobacter formigenes]